MLIFDEVLETTILRTRNLKAIWNAVLGNCVSQECEIQAIIRKSVLLVFLTSLGGVQQRDW